jgi:dTMP kinase
MMVSKGVFICIEGLDGCGKTTQAKLLVRRLRRKYDTFYTAEPSSGKIGKFIKKHCLHSDKRSSGVVEALLCAADRFEHVENTILPALKKGRIAVSDRYVYSSFAYQGATGLDIEWIEKINEHAIRPDVAIVIDVEPVTVVQRLKPRKSLMENLETQRKVREVYLKFIDRGELVRVDGNKSKREVARDIATVVQRLLNVS